MKFPWIKRNDLIIQPHDTGGWLIKDPVSLQYTLLSAVEFGLFQRMNGQTDAASLLAANPHSKYTIEDLQTFLSHLIKRQLLFRVDGGDSQRLSTPKAKPSPITLLTRLLSWYVPLGNPQSILRHLRWVSSLTMQQTFLRCCGVVFAVAAVVLMMNFGNVTSAVGQLARHFTTATAISMLGIVVAVKLAHELGHALSAQHFGADCHEAGILFLFLTPVPFTNVTDSWKLPVHQRMIVTAAGMLVELLIASVCLILWAVAADSMTRTLLLQTAVVCSVNTVLFNGNPLLRFDGYFLLSDLLGIPNLSARSFERLRSRIVVCVSGQSDSVSPKDDRKDDRETTLVTYAVLAGVYRIVLAFTILEAIHIMCSSNDFEILGWFLKVLTVGLLLAVPLLKTLLAVAATIPLQAASPTDAANSNTASSNTASSANAANADANAASSGWEKGLTRTLVVFAAFTFACLIPLPSRIVALATVAPSEHKLFSQVSGRLEIDARDSDPDFPLTAWRLINSESETSLLSLQAEAELNDLRLKIANRTQRLDPETSLQQLKEAADSARTRLEEAQKTISQQSQPIKSTKRRLIACRRFRKGVDGSFDQGWTGQPLSLKNLGAWIERGTTLGYRQPDDQATMTVFVPQHVIQDVHPGQAATFRLNAGNASLCSATVVGVSRFPVDVLPENIALSGEISGRFEDAGFRPDDVFFAVTIRSTDDHVKLPLPLNAIGHAAIRRHNRSIATRFCDYLRRTFLMSNGT